MLRTTGTKTVEPAKGFKKKMSAPEPIKELSLGVAADAWRRIWAKVAMFHPPRYLGGYFFNGLLTHSRSGTCNGPERAATAFTRLAARWWCTNLC